VSCMIDSEAALGIPRAMVSRLITHVVGSVVFVCLAWERGQGPVRVRALRLPHACHMRALLPRYQLLPRCFLRRRLPGLQLL
jgi:hypothetical protein